MSEAELIELTEYAKTTPLGEYLTKYHISDRVILCLYQAGFRTLNSRLKNASERQLMCYQFTKTDINRFSASLRLNESVTLFNEDCDKVRFRNLSYSFMKFVFYTIFVLFSFYFIVQLRFFYSQSAADSKSFSAYNILQEKQRQYDQLTCVTSYI